MFYNFEQFTKHQKRFVDAFIDLKVEGWKQYSSALDDYTLGYWKNILQEFDKQVETTAQNTKQGIFGDKK
jgi:hypothetical protein